MSSRTLGKLTRPFVSSWPVWLRADLLDAEAGSASRARGLSAAGSPGAEPITCVSQPCRPAVRSPSEVWRGCRFSRTRFDRSYPALLAADDACLLLAVNGHDRLGYLLGFEQRAEAIGEGGWLHAEVTGGPPGVRSRACSPGQAFLMAAGGIAG